MSVELYLVCKSCRKCIEVGSRGNTFWLALDKPEALKAATAFLDEHTLCEGHVEVLYDYDVEDGMTYVEWTSDSAQGSEDQQ